MDKLRRRSGRVAQPPSLPVNGKTISMYLQSRDDMEPLMDLFVSCDPCKRDALPPDLGVYAFYEGDELMYVGKVDREGGIKDRVTRHLHKDEGNASFICNLAGDKVGSLSRKSIVKMPVFDDVRDRVKAMTIRWVKISNSRLRKQFEAYAHVMLNPPYSSVSYSVHQEKEEPGDEEPSPQGRTRRSRGAVGKGGGNYSKERYGLGHNRDGGR